MFGWEFQASSSFSWCWKKSQRVSSHERKKIYEKRGVFSNEILTELVFGWEYWSKMLRNLGKLSLW